MSDDLVALLRSMGRREHDDLSLGEVAADCIEMLEAENARLRDALIGALAIASRNEDGDYIDRARAALNANKK